MSLKKIDEALIASKRAIITTDTTSFQYVDPGTIFVNENDGTMKIKLKDGVDWSLPSKRGIHIGSNPPASPEVGDLWLDTSK